MCRPLFSHRWVIDWDTFFYYICDGQQFHQYQQNQQLPLSPQITRKAMKYGIRNPDPGFMTGSKCDGI
jgi:hypothetical protein